MTTLGPIRILMIASGGVAAILGLYWDDAWHTDVGRDAFLSPPHLLLYAGVTVLLATTCTWAWQRVRREGLVALRDPALSLPLIGATVTLGAAPVDELWHQLFGRDAVTWSPPHMVAVAGLLAFAAGLLLLANRDRRPPRHIGAVIGAFLIAAAVTVVMEFETDVPQFPIVTYLPVLVAALTFAFALLSRVDRARWVATRAAAVYVVLRIAVVGFLMLLGHSLPTVMPTVVAAWVFDVTRQRSGRRWTIAAATGTATVGSHVVAHVLQPAGLGFTVAEVLVGLVVAIAVAYGVLAAVGVGHGSSSRLPRRIALAAGAAMLLLGWASPALAHDPGQGEEVAPVALTAVREDDHIAVRAIAPECTDWEPVRVVARRAGRAHTSPLTPMGECRFQGEVAIDDPGRWFVYVEVEIGGARTEAWLPVEDAPHLKSTDLYRPPSAGTPLSQILAGVLLYLVVVGILGGVVVAYRRITPRAASAGESAEGYRAPVGLVEAGPRRGR